MSFKLLGLKEELVTAVTELGFAAPMPIQKKAIPALLANDRDFVGLAQTGTGKTCAFGLPLIQLMAPAIRQPQGIIICPTRELCMQITADMVKFSKNIQKMAVVAVYGGASIVHQINRIKAGAQIVVATPGRLLDLINRRVVKPSCISHVVLDEADEMLNMGFQEDIDAILGHMPKEKRIWLFSATMPSGVAAIARKYLTKPLEVTVGGKNQSPKNITHTGYVILEKHRYPALRRIIDFTPDMFGLVFCRTRNETRTVAESLVGDGYQAEALHGDLSQDQRDYVMRKFRSGSVQILVATDVAARGLDVDDITHVINYNLPDETETYTHRSGRTARAGKSGTSVVLVNKKEMYKVRRVEQMNNIRFNFGKIPDGKDICQKQLLGLVEKIANTDVNRKEIEAYLPAVYDALEKFDKEELINRFISAEFNRFLEYYQKTGDINIEIGDKKPAVSVRAKNSPVGRAKGSPVGKTSGKPNGKFKAIKTQRFLINFGRLDKINEGTIVRFICEKSGIRSNMIGAINLNQDSSFFEVNNSAAAIVNDSMKNARLDGRQVRVRKVV
ncbi:MAG: DEAD/DEAH box helicase [Desulfobacterales bacterium]|nr:DEAD/DEAH box helicase [Desulfobacterales bacterium]